MKTNKKWLIVVVIIIVIAILYSFAERKVEYFYGLALDPSVPKTVVFSNKINKHENQYPNVDIPGKVKWLEKTASVEDMKAFDGTDLKAYYIQAPKKSDKWAIVIHGYTQDPRNMAPNAYEFYKRGFNVLMPNLRGHGLSGGNYIGMGWVDRKDVIKWINGIIKENPKSKIVLYGISMGAATVMMTSGEQLPSNVKCFIEDCGYTSAWDEFSYQLKSIYGLPSFPLMNMVNSIVRKKDGYDLRDASALNQIKKCTTPMMFIHGSKDTFVPFYMQDILYNAAPMEKEKMVIKDAGHGESYKKAPEIYWTNVFKFINRYLTDSAK